MKFVTPKLTKLAAAFLFAAAGLTVYAQQTKAAASPSTNNAALPKARARVQMPRASIEFSGPATSPALPKPNTKIEDLEDRFNIRGVGGHDAPQDGVVPNNDATPAPNRATLGRALRDMDRKKNWMVPGAQDKDLGDPAKAFQNSKDDDLSDDEKLGLSKKESVMERYIHGSKDRRGGKDGEDRDLRSGRNDRNGRDDNGRDSRDDSRDDPESNGLADFNLHSALSPGMQRSGFSDLSKNKDFEPFRATQPGRSEISGFGAAPDRSRIEAREREAAHSAEFQQILKPRGDGASDPLSSMRDLTRREMNPTLPRSFEAGGAGERSAFSPPPASHAPIHNDNSLFGVTGPGSSSLTPAVSAPPVYRSQTPPASQRLIPDPPRKIF